MMSREKDRPDDNLYNQEPTKITAGYKKFVIDDVVAEYDYNKGTFTEDEIKDAFHTIDFNKDGSITFEDLKYFLEYIGEKATEEEIEEMIRMCDLNGNHEVSM